MSNVPALFTLVYFSGSSYGFIQANLKL
jgi:hypothetical protein